ncbi:two-component system, OmpR family, osmolarity sensor histidine kinase EnvZ [Kosakonia arachidis]|uniref:Sensor histidine kinase EnvZ n=1 Tax=Kosakonia arachidis TaxID=551989 RepID=A0A1I7C9U5_9ENTR|nr:ATP-binding protein [Kosakonia arachidis]SFT96192.1 two-component system, OmpR family, osmolarity sensor histidine kinase EnvZ [Kosakonia arachidis]
MKKFWPRSLLARNSVLLILLVTLTQFTTLAVFLVFVQKPRVNDAASLIASQIVMLDKLLATVPAGDRDRYVQVMPGVTQPPQHSIEIPSLGLDGFYRRYYLKVFLDSLYQKLPAGIQLRLEQPPGNKLWVEVNTAGQPYWIALAVEPSNPLSGLISAILLSVVLSLMALLTAYALQRRINRPLTSLARAAADVGKGGWPRPLLPEGPTEIKTVSLTFNRMLDGLAEMENTRAQMLAGISHDLRTPLTKLRLSLAMREQGKATLDDFGRYFDDVDNILQQFIDYARGSATELTQPGDINQMITELAHDFTGLGQNFSLNLTPLPVFLFRPVSVMRLLTNLMQNAAKYGRTGLEVASWREHNVVKIAVRDDGPGVSEQDLLLIIKPFHRGAGTAARHNGSGLGLAIAHQIARHHGGDLSVNSREGGGLEVMVTLPLV